MKTLLTIRIKRILMLACTNMLALAGFANPHVTMSLKNITSSNNTIEYDLFIINDGNTAIKLSACSYGVNFNETIVNGGSISYSFQKGSRGEALNGLSSFSVATTKVGEINQARMTSTPSQFENAVELIPKTPFKVGRFKLTNSVAWTKNSHPSFALQEVSQLGLTATQIVGYVGANTNLIALTPILKTVSTEVEESPLLNPSAESSSIVISDKSDLIHSRSNLTGDISIYPNPVTTMLNIDLVGNKSSIIIRISDMNAHLVKQIQTNISDGLNKISVDVSGLSEGVYSIKIQDEKSDYKVLTFSK